MTKRSIVHIEIPAKAPKEAQEFYSKLFGWEMSVVEDFDYHSFMAENTGGIIAPRNTPTVPRSTRCARTCRR